MWEQVRGGVERREMFDVSVVVVVVEDEEEEVKGGTCFIDYHLCASYGNIDE